MAFDLPKLTDQVDVAIATKTANSLNALRDGTAKYGGISTGAGNVYDCVFDPVFTAYNEPMLLSFRAHQDNAGSATFKADALAALTIKKFARGAQVNLVSGDIKSDQVYFVFYQATVGVAVLLNPSQIADGQLSSNIVLYDAAGLFTAIQKISVNSSPMIEVDRPSGDDYIALQGEQAGTVRWKLAVISSEPKFRLQDSAGTDRFTIDMSDGSLVKGIVPLARIGIEVTTSHNFTSISAHSSQSFSVTVTGAQVGDHALVSSETAIGNNTILSARATLNNVDVTLFNNGTSAFDPNNSVFNIAVFPSGV